MTLRRKSRPYAWLVGMLLASVSTVPGYAVENVRREVHHFFECLDMMLSSPADHKANCQPNRVPGPFGSIQSTGGSDTQPVAPPAPPAPPVPPVVVAEPPPPAVVEPPPPPPPAPDPCACGSCYAT